LRQQLRREFANARFEARNHPWCESAGDQPAEFGVERRIEKDEPLGSGHTRAEGFVIVQQPLRAFVVKNQEGVERRRHAQDRRRSA